MALARNSALRALDIEAGKSSLTVRRTRMENLPDFAVGPNVEYYKDDQIASVNASVIYETTTAPKGEVEIENWVTWKTSRVEGKRDNEFDFRHEIEYGVTDRFQLGLYVADWKVLDAVAGGEKGLQAIYQDTALEAIYSLTNPVTDLIGSAVYGEI